MGMSVMNGALRVDVKRLCFSMVLHNDLCSRARSRTCVCVTDQTAASGDTASSRGSFLDRLGAGSDGSCSYRGEALGGARRPQFRPRTSDHSVYARAHRPLPLPLPLPAILLLTLLLLNVLIMLAGVGLRVCRTSSGKTVAD